MAESAPSARRLWIRATLVAGVVLSSVALIAVWKGRHADAPAPPPLSRETIQVRIVDELGGVVPGAAVDLQHRAGQTPPSAAWSPDSGTLRLAGDTTATALRLTARGYRTRRVARVADGQRVVLEPGLQVRVLVRGVPRTGLPAHVRLLLRVKPLDAGAQDPHGLSAAEVVDLMDNLGASGSGPKDIPRGDFGYPVSLAQARAGVLVPRPGRYHVHWGLIDVPKRTWFSLGDSCGRPIEVEDTPGAQTFELAMTLAQLQSTLDGLRERVGNARGK